jgi:hypothetical protein
MAADGRRGVWRGVEKEVRFHVRPLHVECAVSLRLDFMTIV